MADATDTNPNPGRGPDGGPPPLPGPSARTKLSSVAAHLVAEYTAGPFENNTKTELVYIELSPTVLYSTLANTIKPIVYGNFRNIGARTVTDVNDVTLLDNVILTVTTNACVAAYSVTYNKALKIDSSCTGLFGGYNPVDCLRFPCLTTLLINSLGPVETDSLPYKCKFVPYIRRAGIDTLLGQNGFTSHYYELFLQAMKRGRTVNMTDVDINNDTSSHWWTLFADNYKTSSTTGDKSATRKNSITVYCPFRFADRDHAVTLGAFVLEDTLYETPGPLLTSMIGPFATQTTPTEIDNIPAAFRNALALNRHCPAIFVSYSKIEHLTNSQAIVYGALQNEQSITSLASNTAYSGTLPTYDYEADYHVGNARKKRKVVTAAGATASTSSTSTAVALTTGPMVPVSSITAGLWIATVHYFDHVLVDKVPISRRNNIITTANQID